MRNPDGPVTGRPPVRAERGMVATSHYLGSATGLQMLRAGGSAVDACIAANAVLCVAYPHMAGLGGDAFALVHRPGSAVEALNASGPAAALATRDYYRSRGHVDSIPTRGPLSALTVPGAVDGWRELHERHGRLEWADLFDDAITYAREGLAVPRSLAEWTADDVPELQEQPGAARTYLPGRRPVREGDRLRNGGLAHSLELIAHRGPREAFYAGELADRLCAGAGEGSPLRPDDFAAFRAEWVEPITGSYRGRTAFEFPPNTQGFAALEILGLLEGLDVSGFGDGTADYYHHAAEAVKLAFADRNAWLTDPRSLEIPLDRLLSADYLATRRGLIDSGTAMVMEDVAPGIPGPAERASADGADGDTCYFCAVDADGMAVSMIQSIYHDFGSTVVPEGTGILLQNRGSFFSLADSHPNALEPGKRTFHTLIPAMLGGPDGEPELVYGTMGGEGQPQTHAAMVTRLVDFGYDVQQAIEAPRWLMGRTWGTTSQDLSLEGRIPDGVIRELERRGQPVKVLADWDDNMGHAQAIRIDRESGFLEGGADPRGDGLALGY